MGVNPGGPGAGLGGTHGRGVGGQPSVAEGDGGGGGGLGSQGSQGKGGVPGPRSKGGGRRQEGYWGRGWRHGVRSVLGGRRGGRGDTHTHTEHGEETRGGPRGHWGVLGHREGWQRPPRGQWPVPASVSPPHDSPGSPRVGPGWPGAQRPRRPPRRHDVALGGPGAWPPRARWGWFGGGSDGGGGARGPPCDSRPRVPPRRMKLPPACCRLQTLGAALGVCVTIGFTVQLLGGPFQRR